jgi:hypothetical protein
MKPNDPKVVELERTVKTQARLLNTILNRLTLLERENARRRNDVRELNQALSKRG